MANLLGLCGICSEKCSKSDLILRCSDACNLCYHSRCVGMTEDNYKKMSSTYRKTWKCQQCKKTNRRSTGLNDHCNSVNSGKRRNNDIATSRMDQPVVMLERLPDGVIQKYLNKEMKVFEYNHGYKFFQGELLPNNRCVRKKPHWIKRSVNPRFYNKTTFHKQSNYKVVTNAFSGNFNEQRNSELYNKTEKFHPGRERENSFVVDPKQLCSSELQTTNIHTSLKLENAKHFSNSQDRTTNKNEMCSEQILKQGKKRYRSGEKVNSKDPISVNEEIAEDNETPIHCEEFDSYDWQIVSEASCSDVSRDSSPSRENLHDAEYSIHTELEDNEASKQKTTLLPQNEKLNEVGESDDDRLTEPYRSECEEEIENKEQTTKSKKSCKPYLRIKLTGSHKNGFTNVTDENGKEKLTKNESKSLSLIDPCVKNEQNHISISVSRSTCVSSAAIGNDLPKEKNINHTGLLNNNHSVPSKHIKKVHLNASNCSHSNTLENSQKGESSNNFSSQIQKNKTQENILLLAGNNCHDSEVKSTKSSGSHDNQTKREGPGNKQIGQIAQDEEKSEPANTPRNLNSPLNTENKKENAQNGQHASKESKFNRYDYVGLIMQTMDKSTPYSVTTKSDDISQKSNATTENQNIPFKSNGINKVLNNKETSVLSGGKEHLSMPCLKQKKARMSRVTSLSKSFLCKDLKGTAINKTEYVNYASRSIEQNESKSGPIVKDHIKINGDNEKIYRKQIVINNIVNSSNKTLSSQVLVDKQSGQTFRMKTPKCWRCGKPFVKNSVTERLCKQCISLDYTAVTQKLNNINPGHKSKNNDYNKSLKIYNCWKNKNSSVKQSGNSPEWKKSPENTSPYHSKSISLLHNKNVEDKVNNMQTENDNLSSLKFVFSLGSKKLVEKISRDKEVIVESGSQPKRMKKKRMRSASDTMEGIYETNKCVTTLTRENNGGNLICKISRKKRKHKDLPRRKKKPKLEDESSDVSDGRNLSSDDVDQLVSGYYSEDNITSRCKSKDITNKFNEVSLNQSIMNQTENKIANNNDKQNKSSLNKKGNCEVRNVNRGLFLLSYSETDEVLCQFQSGLCEQANKESNQTEQINAKEDSCAHLKTLDQLKVINSVPETITSSPEQADVTFQKLLPSDSVISDSNSKKELAIKQQSPTLLELQELVLTSQPSRKEPSQEMTVFQNIPLVENKTESNKLPLPESKNRVCEDNGSENKLSMLRIESVYSLKDIQTENKSNDVKTAEVKMPFLFNHNIYNELDAYTTASILDMDGTKERSLTVLMSLLSREYKELQYVHQASKKSEVVTTELQNEKLRHIDNIRTLQLACALFKQCQKCNKELSPEMLHLKPEEISQLLIECSNGTVTEAAAKNNAGKDAYVCLKLGANDKQEEESQKLTSEDTQVISGIIGETKASGKLTMHTTNTRKTVKFLLDQQKQQLDATTSTTAAVIDASTIKRKSDDDVICLGISQLPRSSVQVVHPLDSRNISQNDSSNSIQQSEMISSKSDSQSTTSISPNAVPPNVSVIKSHGLASPPVISNFITTSTSNSIPLHVIPGLAVNHPLQVAVNVVTSAAAYQKTAVGYVKHQNYSLPANSLSVQKEPNDNSKQLYITSQLNKLPSGTSWIPNTIQNQWSSHPSQVLTTSTTNEVLTNMRNQAWRNNSPIQSNTPPSVPNQQKSVQQMPVGTNPMLPLINQYGTSVSGHVIHGGLPVQAARNLPPVPPMYNHSTTRTWHQSPNPVGAALRPAEQTPVVCIACRKPIGMTCPTGMFCSDICKKSYCAHFPSYR